MTASEARTSTSSSRSSSSVISAVDHDKEWLPQLIAKYGGSLSTAWIEERYSVWRGKNHQQSNPRVQGYLARGKFYFAWGNPICRDNDEVRREIAHEFVEWATKTKKKKVVWCVINGQFADILGQEMDWSVLSCVREDILHPDIKKLDQKDVRQNIRRAERSHVTFSELHLKAPSFLPDDATREEIDSGIERWKANRHGKQIAAADLLPWLDSQHRRYFIARDEHQKIVAICVLASIAHQSYSVKHAVTFPEAPHGVSEAILAHVIHEMQFEGKNNLTFGASAQEDLDIEYNLGGWKIKMLGKAYRKIVSKYGLANRGQFRAKFGTEEEPLHIAYPQHGFGWAGLVALMHMMRA
ncbi:uncharacterized protein JCM6883_003120 [Sporobolomyces salmoneus]|uniref:uncharacterized protein n=1 Tax=Sporobolomyces salmoneus TaxID=183962 RepID=UPI0031733A5C